MRWPFITRAAHDRHIEQIEMHHQACVDLMQEAVNREYGRAMAEGSARVHKWAIEAHAHVFHHPNPRGAAAAAFQVAEQQFRATPLTVREFLEGAPANVKEAVDAVTGS